MKRIKIYRHAQSEANVGLKTNNEASILITDAGKLQAIQLADSIEKAPELIICSPFLRTQQTAAPTIEKFPEAMVEIWECTHEMLNLSQAKLFEHSLAYRQRRVMEYWKEADPIYVDGADAENFIYFIGRVKLFLEKLSNISENEIIVFCHGRFIQAVIWCLLQNSFDATPEFMRNFVHFFTACFIQNCGGIELVYLENRWLVRGM